MGGFSAEMVFLAFLGLILFGPRKLPEMARTAGRILAELKRATSEFQGQLNRELKTAEFEDPTKNLLGSLADSLKAVNTLREPAKAIMSLADPPPQEQPDKSLFLNNLTEYLAQSRAASEAQNAEQASKPVEAVASATPEQGGGGAAGNNAATG